MEKKINEMKVLIELAEKAYKISLCEDLDEDTTDAAYTEYWDHLYKIAAIIVDLTKIDETTALKMAAHKKDKILAIINRMAA